MSGLRLASKLQIGGKHTINTDTVGGDHVKKEIVWPHGHQAAAMICIMLDAEFIWLGMDPEKYDTPKHRSMGEYGPRRGINRILEALDRFQVKATFFAPGIFGQGGRDCRL